MVIQFDIFASSIQNREIFANEIDFINHLFLHFNYKSIGMQFFH